MQLLGALGGGHVASWIRSHLIDRLSRELSAIVTLSETSKQRLVKYGLDADRISPIYHYQIAMGDTATPQRPFSEPSVLYAGSLTEVRGPQVAIQAMENVVREVPDAVLRIVGPDNAIRPYRPELDALVRKLGLEKNVLFLGKKSNEAVIALIQRSNVVVVPLQWPNEFGPVILIEAKYLGKPVVASRIGGTPEFIVDGEDGFLAAHDRPKVFAHRIIYLLQHPEEAQRIGKKARRSVDFLCNNTSVSKIVDLYQNIINIGRPS